MKYSSNHITPESRTENFTLAFAPEVAQQIPLRLALLYRPRCSDHRGVYITSMVRIYSGCAGFVGMEFSDRPTGAKFRLVISESSDDKR